MSSEHYFTALPSSDLSPRKITVILDRLEREVHVASGVFSPDQIDAGTSVLLNHVPPPASEGDLLDLGCGWGPLALTLALRSPHATVWAIDINERALELTRRNVAEFGLSNVHVCTPDQVPKDVQFSTIWTNPPIRVGKNELHNLLSRWLPRLNHSSDAWLVARRTLGADTLHTWLKENLPENFSIRRAATDRGYRLLRVRHAIPKT